MDPGGIFNFQHLPNCKFSSIEKTEVKESVEKWSMSDGLKFQSYSFDKPFRKYSERDFLLDFFGCSNVASTLLISSSPQTFSHIGVPAETVKFSEVPCTLTTLHLFDKLKEANKIVRSNGSIVKCMPRYISAGVSESDATFEMEIADNLRKFIFYSESEADDDDDFEFVGNVLTGTEKKEYLFALFSHFVLGGSLCQYEDNIEPYIEVTKLLYKDLIAVARAEETGDGDKLNAISYVYKIHSASNECAAGTGKGNLLFHRHYVNNFFYIIVNPLKQLCFTMYHHV